MSSQMHRARPAWALGVAAIALIAASCSSGTSSARPASSTAASAEPTKASGGAAPADSPRVAVTGLLEAEKTSNHAASYRFISERGRAKYRDSDDWAHLRDQLPAVTGFHIDKTSDSVVEVVVDHQPGLDPFVGLSLAHDRERWTVRREGGRWTVDPEPAIDPILPDEDKAAGVALQWATAIQKCDSRAAAKLQALERLFGSADAAGKLCHSRGALKASKVTDPPNGPDTADLLGQYGGGVLVLSRAVTVTGGPAGVGLILVPIGDDWRVIATFDS